MSGYEIHILGTGGDSAVVGRAARLSGGFVIKTPQSQVHIDPGTGALIGLAKSGLHPRETTAVVLSHQHVNHSSEAATLISASTHNGMDKKGILLSNNLDLPFFPEVFKGFVERAIELVPNQRVGINDVNIMPFPVQHYDTDALGFVLTTPMFSVGYTGDTKFSSDLINNLKNANILIINCKFPNNGVEGDHLCADDVIKILKEVKPQLAILTHFGAKMLSADPLAQARYIHRMTHVEVVAAKDGLRIAPTTHDIKRPQKTLSDFKTS